MGIKTVSVGQGVDFKNLSESFPFVVKKFVSGCRKMHSKEDTRCNSGKHVLFVKKALVV